jgi:hypothetical protein
LPAGAELRLGPFAAVIAAPLGSSGRLSELLQDVERPRFIGILLDPQLRCALEERDLADGTRQRRVA